MTLSAEAEQILTLIRDRHAYASGPIRTPDCSPRPGGMWINGTLCLECGRAWPCATYRIATRIEATHA